MYMPGILILLIAINSLQGIIFEPNDFKILMNKLKFGLEYAKYVDETTTI